MECPGGHSLSIYARASNKRELHGLFHRKRAIIVTSEHSTTIFFSHYNLFLGKLKEKLARKARVNAERVYRIVLMSPRHPIIPLSNYSLWPPYR